MRILLINSVCKKGSTGKIVYDLYTELRAAGHEAAVCYGRGPAIDEPDIFKFTRDYEVYLHGLKTRLTGWAGSGNRAATRRLLRHIESKKPDIVHLHNIHGYYVDAYKLLEYLKQNKIRTVSTMHDEWLFTGKCGHPYDCNGWKNNCGNCRQLGEYPKSMWIDRTKKELEAKRRVLRDFENIVFVPVAAWLMNQAKKSPHLADKRFEVIHNGIDTEVFVPTAADQLREKLKLTGEKVILHVTPNFNDPRKGGKFLLELARCLENENVKVIVVGANKPQGDTPDNMIWFSRTENRHELAALYSLADIFVLTSEMECLPTVCIEALCCGTPVAGFDRGGAQEAAPEGYGFFVEYGDMDALEETVRSALSGDAPLAAPEDCARYGRAHYAKEIMTGNYLALYGNM